MYGQLTVKFRLYLLLLLVIAIIVTILGIYTISYLAAIRDLLVAGLLVISGGIGA